VSYVDPGRREEDAVSVTELLTRDSSEIIDRATDTMLGMRVGHYASLGKDKLRRRIEGLYARLLASVECRNPSSMIQHARTIADARFAAGFGLHEVLTAFNVIEEAVWLRLEAKLPPAEFAAAIRVVSSVLGMGKDALATSYVKLAAHTHAPVRDVAALFRGTDGA
jgi:hypothetical protein